MNPQLPHGFLHPPGFAATSKPQQMQVGRSTACPAVATATGARVEPCSGVSNKRACPCEKRVASALAADGSSRSVTRVNDSFVRQGQ